MLKAFVEKITELVAPQIVDRNGHCVVVGKDGRWERIEAAEPDHAPDQITVSGLDSICKLIRTENDHYVLPMYVSVCTHGEVKVLTGLQDGNFTRYTLYAARVDYETRVTGTDEPEKFGIKLRSKFLPTEDQAYLIDLISKINYKNGVTLKDDGVAQTVETMKGVSFKEEVKIKPKVCLRPFRTFLEVTQPESEFIFRVDEHGNFGLFEADGGAWKLEAKQNIAAYFEDKLSDLIAEGKVVVMV